MSLPILSSPFRFPKTNHDSRREREFQCWQCPAQPARMTSHPPKGRVDVPYLTVAPPPSDILFVEGARQNNLKNISLGIPHNQVTAITGLSGSGKSSLAFDTLFAEGQWRYVESLSTYARMFLDKVARPDVDRILNVRPAIAIEQKNQVRTARSTVGTATEIADLLRLLFAKLGRPICPDCHVEPCPLLFQQLPVDADPSGSQKSGLRPETGKDAMHNQMRRALGIIAGEVGQVAFPVEEQLPGFDVDHPQRQRHLVAAALLLTLPLLHTADNDGLCADEFSHLEHVGVVCMKNFPSYSAYVPQGPTR